MEKMEFKTKSQLVQEHFHEYLENKLKTDGYSKIESDLYFKFEEYINSRLATIETTMSMVANGIALQKDTGVALLRELPNDETFTILFNGVEQTVSRDEYIVYLEHKAVEAVANAPTPKYAPPLAAKPAKEPVTADVKAFVIFSISTRSALIFFSASLTLIF